MYKDESLNIPVPTLIYVLWESLEKGTVGPTLVPKVKCAVGKLINGQDIPLMRKAKDPKNK
jgi:hypothetical protein